MTEVKRFVVAGWVDAIDLGPEGLRLLRYDDGETGGHGLAVEHRCKVIEDVQLVVAPRLPHHEVAGTWPDVTVHPSVLCPDCQLHGYVRDGRWVPA